MKLWPKPTQMILLAPIVFAGSISALAATAPERAPMKTVEKQITRGKTGHIVTNIGAWSPDGKWIVYDIRSTPGGDQFDGSRIEMVNVETGEVKVLYESRNGAHCGVATFHPREMKVIFILGPENPTPDWQYGFSHRQGVIVDCAKPGKAMNLDARDLTPPFTPGALRGGSHVHVWDPHGEWVSFTYNDALVEGEIRDVAVSIPGKPVRVRDDHPRNQDGKFFSALVTRTVAKPKPGSDEIKRACEEGWIGTNGYVRVDGSQQKRALAFQGEVLSRKGETVAEVFVADLPDDMTKAAEFPLAGTETRRPCPPKGIVQRRLTFTTARKFPGIQGPRHWLRSSPDGSRIAFLMKDERGVVQLWTISPNGGEPAQLTHNAFGIASTFTWSPDGRRITHVMDNSITITDVSTGATQRLTPRSDDATAPRPEACVFSPDGKKIAYVRRILDDGQWLNQVFVLALEE